MFGHGRAGGGRMRSARSVDGRVGVSGVVSGVGLVDFVLGPVVSRFDIATDTDDGVAGVQGGEHQKEREVFHGFRCRGRG